MPERLSFIVPGSLETPTGGYRYDRQVVAGLRARGHRVDVLTLGESFPQPDAPTLQASYRALAGLPDGPAVIDGLALGALPEIGAHLPAHAPLIALVHHPLALESGLAPDIAERLRVSERQALAAARHAIATSPTTADILVSGYGLSRDRIAVALPGVEPAPLARGSGGESVQLLSVGSVIARKGHDLLIAALAPLAGLSWHLTIVGDATRDAEALRALQEAIRHHGLQKRVSLTGALSETDLAARYDAADLFVLASHYEGYGMVFSEALAHGLPVVATAVGEAATLLPQTAGKLTPPGHPAALSAALEPFLADPAVRRAARQAAIEARDGLPRWSDSVAVFEETLRRCHMETSS
ncbi:MAG: glycosyltransferase family 4 protein [Alphaproteobacteria bacterium]